MEPILNMSKPVDVGTNRRLQEIAVNVTKSTTKVHVTLLNVTTMSEYRKDAHTSFYGSRNGLPDTWNELLSMYIIHRS
ncbi:hypothetical protein Bca52824_003563 [Brassica carinata]|uniref:Trichome birefringence-like C-terminal domain-containing protein n=1 Tax=Brassica carinata TaxID=52824 RepID=A0A8X7WQH0_BRACI|nr:hypothetical protein Bca52824_003563 [Brassica carinata]